MKPNNHKLKAMLLSMTAGAILLYSPVYGAGEEYLTQLESAISVDFEENVPINREDFCVAIARTFLPDTQADSVSLPFEDAAQIDSGNLSAIKAVYQTGVLSGSMEDGKLYMHPKATITRQDAIALLGRMLEVQSVAPLSFTDKDQIAPYALAPISWFVEQGILNGYPDGGLRPESLITTNEAAIFIVRAAQHAGLIGATPGVAGEAPVLEVPEGVSTFAGTGSRGDSNGEAARSRFTLPHGVIMDGSGGIIVFDTYNNLIRRVKDGNAETVSGSSNGWDEQQLPRGGYLDTETKDAKFNRPMDGDYNSNGELFIADSGNHVIRFEKAGRIYTFSGSTQGYKDGNREEAQFNTPSAIAIDQNDNIYIADTLNHCIRKVDTKGVVSTIAGRAGTSGYQDGAASSSLFYAPSGIAVSPGGQTIYVADTGNHRIRTIANNTVSTLAGITEEVDDDGDPIGDFRDGISTQAMFFLPRGLDYSGGVLFVADSGNNRVRAILPSGTVTTVAGSEEPGDGLNDSLLNAPSGVKYHRGHLYIADTYNNKIKIMAINVDDLAK